jgi:hypothetical protein
VIALENTLNGTILPQEDILAIAGFAKKNNIALHLDGARIWHVAAATGAPLAELLAPFASASLCFSKGLGAPVGSVLVGPRAFVQRARWFRKLFGGGMRQTGVLAASAAYALTHNFAKLHAVHALALRLQAGLEDIGVRITSRAETCMVRRPGPRERCSAADARRTRRFSTTRARSGSRTSRSPPRPRRRRCRSSSAARASSCTSRPRPRPSKSSSRSCATSRRRSASPASSAPQRSSTGMSRKTCTFVSGTVCTASEHGRVL